MKTIILPSIRVQQFEKVCDILYEFGEKYEDLAYLDESEIEDDYSVDELVDETSLKILAEIEKYEWF